MKQIEKLAVDEILEKGVRVTFPAPFFLRIFIKDIGVAIKMPTYGQLLKASAIAIKSGFDLSGLESGGINEAHRLVQSHGKALTQIVAVFMVRGKWKCKRLSWLLARYILWKATPRKLAEIAMVCVAMSGLDDFTNTIRLLGTMRITAPKNLSHDSQGS